MTDPPLAVRLAGDGADAALVGGKGANLDRLLTLDLHVPATGVVTTSAYRRFVAHPALRELTDTIRAGATVAADEVDDAFLAVDPDDDTTRAALDLADTVGGAGDRLAVRSSATVEDLARSSFAGQYRSLLDVDPADHDAVLAAVRLVFASLWHPAPCAYRRAMGVADDDAAMAVVVMAMVRADQAGVVFTTDPAGQPGAARIEAVSGLGESLVSGERTPDAWVTPRDRPDADVSPAALAALAAALVVEDAVGTPQDVEWAWADDRLWIVQARPITVTDSDQGDGFDSHPGDHDLTTAGIGEMLPGVLPPLRWEVGRHLVDEAFRGVLDDLDALPADPEQSHLVRRVRGRAALDFSRLRHLAERLPGSAADELEAQYFGSRREGRAAVAADTDTPSRLARLRHDRRVLRARRRYTLEGETVVEAIADLCADPVDLAALTARRLHSYRLGLLDLAVRTTAAEMGVAANAASAYRSIELILSRHLGETDAGRWAERVTRRGVAVTPTTDASAAVFGGPTWDELGRTPPTLDRRPDEDDDPLTELEAALTHTGSWSAGTLRAALRTHTLRRIIRDAVAQLRRRERVKAALLRLGGETRRVHLELGRRLTDGGVLVEPADVELLTSAELRAATDGGGPSSDVLARRRRWRDRYAAEPPLPNRFTGHPTPEPAAVPDGDRLDGWAASPGRHHGTATVVHDPTESIAPGAVLVAQATDASWSPLFVDAGAIVLERGGPLSHAAILARELGVPAVLNVPGATSVLDGVVVTVDGDLGLVVVHDREVAS